MNRIPKYLRNHKMYAEHDYYYLQGKGYTNREIKTFWDRDIARGCEPITHAPIIPNMVEYLTPADKAHYIAKQQAAAEARS